MSRLIKSPYAKSLTEESKIIQVNKIKSFPLRDENGFDDEHNTETFSLSSQEINEEIKAKLEHAEIQAAQIVQEAEQQAELLRQNLAAEQQQVYEQIDQFKDEARQVGYNEGYQQGLENAKQEFEHQLLHAQNIIASAKNDYLETIESAQETIIDIATAVAEKLIGNSLQDNHNTWKNLVAAAINEVRDHAEIKIYVHPQWYELTLNHKQELLSFLSHSEELYIYPDLHLPENGCFIETPFGRIDAGIDSQLQEIKHQLHEKLKEGKDGGS